MATKIVSGILRDAAGAVIANATIRFLATATRSTVNTIYTDYAVWADGSYSCTVNFGTYTIQVRRYTEHQFRTICANVYIGEASQQTLEELIASQVHIVEPAPMHTHHNATTSVSGFLSNTDKQKLDGLKQGDSYYEKSELYNKTELYNKAEIDSVIVTHTHPNATTTVSGFLSSTDKQKLDGIEDNANKYIHPTGDGNLHVPATGTSNNGKLLKAGATAGSISWDTISKTDVGLPNVDNTSDANKPVSTAQQSALNLKANLASPALTGTPSAPTAPVGTDTTQIATTAFVNAEIANDAAPKSHVGSTGDAHGVATTSVNGFMSSTDKTKLDGIATGANAYTHPNSGVTTGTYRSVTVDSQGHITAGTNPTTIAGYGITDAAPSSHVGSTGAAHGTASSSVAGFMSVADKQKLDGLMGGDSYYNKTELASVLTIRNMQLALSDFVSVKDYGAIGDGTLHTLQEWVDSGKFASLAAIKLVYPKATALTDSIDWLAIQTACDDAAIKGDSVLVPSGVYLFNKTLYHHIYLYSTSPLPSWRIAPFSSTVAEEYNYKFGSTFLFVGNGPKEQTIKFVSESRQCGYDRPNPARIYNNQYDAEFLLTDFTNKNASGATPATSKPFSAAVVVGTGTTKRPVMGMENIRVIASCPGDGEIYGWKGYADQSAFRDWAHWDVGVWYKSPWRARLHRCQIVGYWDIRGHLMTTFSDYDLQNAGYAEFYDVDRCVIQGGTSFRSGDIWPIIDKTVDTLSVEWTASHQFPSSGTLRTSVGVLTYTGLSYNSTSNTLIFTGCSNTDNVVTSGYAITTIKTTSNLGLANSRISMCELTDFSHSTRVEEQATDFPYKMPYRAAFEMSGYPARGLSIYDTSVFGTGPVSFHLGCARDVEMYSCYAEPKGYRTTFNGPSQAPGAAFIFGPKALYKDKVPNADKGRITITGESFIASANMEPRVTVTAGTRLENGTDYFNPYQAEIGRKDSTSYSDLLILTGLKGQAIKHKVTSTEGYPRYYLECDLDGKTYLGVPYSATPLYIRPNQTYHTNSTTISRNFGIINAVIGSGYYNESVYSSGTYGLASTDSAGNILTRFITFTPYSTTKGNLRLSSDVTTLDSSVGDAVISSGPSGGVRLKKVGATIVYSDSTDTKFYNSISVSSGFDNTVSLGTASNKWSVIYAGTGAINTSDADEKDEVRDVSEQEKNVARKLKIKVFKFKDAIRDKGSDNARWHFGVIAQEVIAAFASEGLDAFDYGLACYDELEATEEQKDEDGIVVQEARPAGKRYGIRYDELSMFILSTLLP